MLKILASLSIIAGLVVVTLPAGAQNQPNPGTTQNTDAADDDGFDLGWLGLIGLLGLAGLSGRRRHDTVTPTHTTHTTPR